MAGDEKEVARRALLRTDREVVLRADEEEDAEEDDDDGVEP